ncbi:MAG: hypothetical protein ABSF25_20905 [Bryobacteraceae bacterium]
MKVPVQLCLLFATLALAVVPAVAQPTVGGILNNYSYTLPGLPNYGIAQGSIFALYGSNMSGSSTGLQNAPLQTTLVGSTLNVTVGSATTHPYLYYVTPTQIAGILPSNTPAGAGTITVTYNNQTSAPLAIQVVASGFGMLSLNNLGSGPAAAENANVNYSLLSSTNAANPGDYIVLWGSGLGPVSGSENTFPQPQTNMTSLPIEVDIGGVSASVDYRGRSQYPGLDEVIVIVPGGVTGCQVSVAVIAGSPSVVSNYGTIPVAPSGTRTCTDPTTSILTASELQTLAGKSTVSYGFIGIGKTTSTTQSITVSGVTIPGSTTVSDSASAAFVRYTSAQFLSLSQSTTSVGSCTLYTYTLANAGTLPNSLPTYLNAGSAVNVTGPLGNQALTLQSGLYYNPASPSFIPTSGGTFSFNNGSGGPDVGAFTTSLTVAAPLTWTNSSGITTVTRSKGVTVNWTGGNSNTYVEISGSAFSGSSSTSVGGYFYCTAPVSAGTFTVPASVLLSLPATGTVSGIPIPGTLSVSNYTNPAQFTASGLDFAFLQFYNSNSIQAAYQ